MRNRDIILAFSYQEQEAHSSMHEYHKKEKKKSRQEKWIATESKMNNRKYLIIFRLLKKIVGKSSNNRNMFENFLNLTLHIRVFFV